MVQLRYEQMGIRWQFHSFHLDYKRIWEERRTSMKSLNEDLKTGQFNKVYLLYGEEAYLKKQYKITQMFII